MTAARVTLDEYEAGELAVEYDDKEPQEVIAWALETFGSRVAISTSFDFDPMAILDMAWRIDQRVRGRCSACSRTSTPGSRDCAATSGRADRTSGRSSSTTITAGSSR